MNYKFTERQRVMLIESAKSFQKAEKDCFIYKEEYGIPDDQLKNWKAIIKELKKRKVK